MAYQIRGAAVVKSVTGTSGNVGAINPGHQYLVLASADCWLNWGTAKDGVRASGYFAAGTVIAGDTVTINGVDFVAGTDFAIGGTAAATVANLVAAINASQDPDIRGVVSASIGTPTSRCVVTAVLYGDEGNSLALAETGDGFTRSGATLTAGADDTDNAAVANAGLLIPANAPVCLIFGEVGTPGAAMEDSNHTLRVQAITATSAALSFSPVTEV